MLIHTTVVREAGIRSDDAASTVGRVDAAGGCSFCEGEELLHPTPSKINAISTNRFDMSFHSDFPFADV
jgi:hypothetical protein